MEIKEKDSRQDELHEVGCRVTGERFAKSLPSPPSGHDHLQLPDAPGHQASVGRANIPTQACLVPARLLPPEGCVLRAGRVRGLDVRR